VRLKINIEILKPLSYTGSIVGLGFRSLLHSIRCFYLTGWRPPQNYVGFISSHLLRNVHEQPFFFWFGANFHQLTTFSPNGKQFSVFFWVFSWKISKNKVILTLEIAIFYPNSVPAGSQKYQRMQKHFHFHIFLLPNLAKWPYGWKPIQLKIVCWTWAFFQILNLPTPDVNVREWSCHCPLMSWNSLAIAHYVMEWSCRCPLCHGMVSPLPIMSWNGLVITHYVGYNMELTLTKFSSSLHLTQHNNMIGKASTIPQQIKKT